MRFLQWLGFPLTVLLLLYGCGGGGGSAQPPSSLAYTTGTAVYTLGVPIAPNNPASTGGAVTSYGVSPAASRGSELSPSTGIITGTPTAATAAAGYTVTAANAVGSTTTTLTITVNAGAAASSSCPT